jgi:hypothetical protein
LRFVGKSRPGFYPLPLSEAQLIRRFLCFPDASSSASDPCIGDGVAFEAITSDADVLRYGVELDAYRAEQARGAPGQPALVEDWAVVERQRQVLLLRRHHTGSLSAADGEEAAGFAGHGREVRN